MTLIRSCATVALLLALAAPAADARDGRLFPRKGTVSPAGNAQAPGSAGIPGCTLAAARAGEALPFGCANALNLEAMLAEPAHLATPATLPPPAGDPAIRAVEQLRLGNVPPPPPAPTGPAPQR